MTENISEHSITDEERLIEYEEYGITYDESSQSYLYQDSLIKNLRDGDFLYTNAAGSIKLIMVIFKVLMLNSFAIHLKI